MPIQVTVKASEPDSIAITRQYDKDEIILGRLPSSDLVLDEPEIDNRHAKLRIMREDESGTPRLLLTDLGSSNGTVVGDGKLDAFREVELVPSQPVVIGKYTLRPEVALDSVVVEKKSVRELIEGQKSKEKPSKGNDKEPADFSGVVNGLDLSGLLVDGDTGADSSRSVSLSVNQDGDYSVSGKLGYSHLLEFDFVASKLVSLTGIVLHRGKPLAGVKVEDKRLGSIVTDREGRFTFAAKPEETEYNIKLSKDGFIFESAEFSGRLDEVSQISTAARQLLTVSGRINHKGHALAGVEVDCGKYGKVATDENGVYCVKNVPEDSHFTITIRKDGYVFRQGATSEN